MSGKNLRSGCGFDAIQGESAHQVRWWTWQSGSAAKDTTEVLMAPSTLRSDKTEVCGGEWQAKGGIAAQMARRPRFPDRSSAETSPEADQGQSRDATRSGGAPGLRGRNTAIENWLQLHLRQLYEEMCSEPLPSELDEMIDRFRRRRQDSESGRDAVVPLPPRAQQGS